MSLDGNMSMGPIRRYCDLPTCSPEIIGEIIKDLRCVFEKSFGNQENAVEKYRSLEAEVNYAKEDLRELLCVKEQLENELIKLNAELKSFQSALDQEGQKRLELERVAGHMRNQLVRADAMLDVSCREKTSLYKKTKKVEADIERLRQQLEKLQQEIALLERENFNMKSQIKCFAQNSMTQSRCKDLEEALIRCTSLNDDLSSKAKELDALNKRLANEDLNTCREESQKLEKDLKICRECSAREISRLRDLVADLKAAVDCLNSHNSDICFKFQEVVSSHHRELQKLQNEIEKYKALYEAAMKSRMEMESKLRKGYDRRPKDGERKSSSKRPQDVIDCNSPCLELLENINKKLSESCDPLGEPLKLPPGRQHEDANSESFRSSRKTVRSERVSGFEYQIYPVLVQYNDSMRRTSTSNNALKSSVQPRPPVSAIESSIDSKTLAVRNSMDFETCGTNASASEPPPSDSSKKAEYYYQSYHKSRRQIRHLKAQIASERNKTADLKSTNDSLKAELGDACKKLGQISTTAQDNTSL